MERWGSNPDGAEPGAVPRSAAGGSPALSFVLSTAEGMLQHCRQAVQPCPSAGATLGWDCPSAGTVPLLALSPCRDCPSAVLFLLQRGWERKADKPRVTQAGEARAPPREQHKGTLGVSLVPGRTATQKAW